MVERHFELTASPRAKALLEDWQTTIEQMWHVVPVGRVFRMEAQGEGRVGASA